jgi:hypothetical protein
LWQQKLKADGTFLVNSNRSNCPCHCFHTSWCWLGGLPDAMRLKATAVVLVWHVPSAAGDNSLVRTGDGRLPADSLVLSTRNIWGIIKSQKDLNLPAHKVRRGSSTRYMYACK